MSEKKVADLTLMDLTERMLQFVLHNDIANEAGDSGYNDGMADALNEMRRDMQVMTEAEFVAKYEQVSMETGDDIFAAIDENDPQAEYQEGYCTQIEEVLNWVNPARIYEQTTMLREGIAAPNETEAAFWDEIFGEGLGEEW